MGLGFYGRSFTMANPNCMQAGCEFKEGALGGECTGDVCRAYIICRLAEINKIIKNGGKQTFYEKDAVQVVTWDKDQWVSWDDQKTPKLKLDHPTQRCLGGIMVWAIGLDETLLEALGKSLTRRRRS